MNNPADIIRLGLDDEERATLAAAAKSVPAMLSQVVGVKAYPAVVQKIRRVASDPKSTVVALAAVVESDLAFSTRMLRLVNSAGVGLTTRCTTIKHAVALLGTRKVADIASAAAALDMVPGETVVGREILAHALGAAAVARLLAPYSGIGTDDAFTATLLHDVGELILVQTGASCESGDDRATAAEQKKLGFDHAALGATVLATWNLPAPIPEVVLRHHDWKRAAARGGDIARFVALVRSADILSKLVLASEQPTPADLEAIRGEPAIGHLGVQPEEVVRIWSSLRAAEREGRALAEPDAGRPAKPATLPPPVPPPRVTAAPAPALAATSTTAAEEISMPPMKSLKVIVVAALAVTLLVGIIVAVGRQSHAVKEHPAAAAEVANAEKPPAAP
jgi:HD-like signal output (HDOD) protein